MLKQVPHRRQRYSTAVIAFLSSLLLLMSGCGGSSSSDSDREPLSGLFGALPISGVSYRQGDAPWRTTGELGQFHYTGDETLTFALGDLTLGSTSGAKALTVANLSPAATPAETPAMINTLVLLQTLDADGSLHNGIQITPRIRERVSEQAASLTLDQPTPDFNAALQSVVDDLESAGAFSDTDSRARRLTTPDDAEENFQRAVSPAGWLKPTAVSSVASKPMNIPGSFLASPMRNRHWANCAGARRWIPSRGPASATPLPGAIRPRKTPPWNGSVRAA